jgi:predicted ATPase
MLGVTLMSTQGFSSPQVQQTYAHARQLCQQLGTTPQIFPALWGLRSFYHVRAEYSTAREIAEQLLQLAESTQNTDLLVEGHLAVGTTSVFQGDLFGARAHLEESLRVYDPQQHRSHAYAYGQDPAVLALCHLASLFAGMGCLDQAVTSIQRALTIAEEIAHPFSLGYARCFAGAIHSARSEPDVTLKHAEQAIALAQPQGFPHLQVMGTLLYGWALAALGKQEEGIGHLCQALDAQKRIGFEVGRSFYLTLLADVYCHAKQWELGFAAVAEGIERAEHKGEWFYAAELYRIKGQLTLEARGWRLETSSSSQAPSLKLLVPNGVEREAEELFFKAIDIARQQTTKLFELRATMALCRLWQLQGKTAQALGRLETLYQWFTEGLETPELQTVRTLLAELG